jgi:hypothetical protein
MTDDLATLIEAARKIKPTDAQREEHRRSFAYGNAAIENSLVTREMIDREADRLASETSHDRHSGSS